jgi:hypothetical protein
VQGIVKPVADLPLILNSGVKDIRDLKTSEVVVMLGVQGILVKMVLM